MIIDLETIEEISGKLFGKVDRNFRFGVNKVSHDSRKTELGDFFVGIKSEIQDGSKYYQSAIKNGAGLLLLNFLPEPIPDVPTIVVKDTKEAMLKLAKISRRRSKAVIIGITGSSGKTTTKEMSASILKNYAPTFMNRGNYNNFLGVTISLIEMDEGVEYGIFEIGTSSPGEIEELSKIINPEIGIFTIIGHSHMENFKNLEAVYNEKIELFKNLTGRKVGILNIDDKFLSKTFSSNGEVIISYSTKDRETDFFGYDYQPVDDRFRFKVSAREYWGNMEVEVNTLGIHMMKNSLAAIALATYLKIPAKIMLNSLKNFNNSGNRLKFEKIKNYLVINDSYNANPESMKTSLITAKEVRGSGKYIAILGDMLELGEKSFELHNDIGRLVFELKFDRFIGVGENMKEAISSAIACGMSKNSVAWYNSSYEAGVECSSFCSGDIILLKGSRGMKMERVIEKL